MKTKHDPNDPSQPSPQFAKLRGRWKMISDMLDGLEAMKRGCATYLPQMENEPDSRYKTRVKCAKFTNAFTDVVEDLAQRPFSEVVRVTDESDDSIVEFCENVDGMGTTLHGFGGESLYSATAYGVHGILIDYPYVESDGTRQLSRAEEKALGLRPTWRHYPALTILEATKDFFEGREQFVRVRLLESRMVRDGFSEISVPRVRVIERPQIGSTYGKPIWQVWEQDDKGDWFVKDQGLMSIGEIPFELFTIARRGKDGKTDLRLPLQGVADLQLTVFRNESALEHIKSSAAFPMLAGDNVQPAIGEDGKPMPLDVGPYAVLYAPNGSWKVIEPSAETMRFLSEDVRGTIKELRELGRQPLTSASGTLTVITTLVAARKANSAVQAWAMQCQSSLYECLRFTALWLGEPDAKFDVMMNMEFDTDFGGEDTFVHVLNMAQGDEPMISRETVLIEAKRRRILDHRFDPEEDLKTIIKEQTEGDGEEGEEGERDVLDFGASEEADA